MSYKGVNKKISYWIHSEFLMQECFDEKRFLKKSKTIVTGKCYACKKGDHSMILEELDNRIKEKINPVNSDNNTPKMVICNAVVSYGRINRRYLVKYLIKKYGLSTGKKDFLDINRFDTRNLNITIDDYIAWGTEQYERVYEEVNGKLELKEERLVDIDLSTLCLLYEALKQNKSLEVLESKYYIESKQNILKQIEADSKNGKSDDIFYSAYNSSVCALLNEMEEYLKDEMSESERLDFQWLKKEAFSVYYRSSICKKRLVKSAGSITRLTGVGLNSFYIEDLEMVRDSLKEEGEDSYQSRNEYNKKLIEYIENNNTSKNMRINISPSLGKKKGVKSESNDEKLKALFYKHLDPSKTSVGKWPTGFSPYLMQYLGVNISLDHFSENSDEVDIAPIFSQNGPPGTGKSTLISDVIADVITHKVLRISEILCENDYDPDSVFDEKYSDINRYSIIVTAATNNAVNNIAAELSNYIEKQNIYFRDASRHFKLPFAASLGNLKNRRSYRHMDSIKTFYAERKLASRDRLKREIKAFLRIHRKVQEKQEELSLKWRGSGAEELWDMYNGESSLYIQAEMSNPADNIEFNRLREELFCRAWKLHQLFAYSSRILRDNKKELLKSISKGERPVLKEGMTEEMWHNMIFFVSPVVSTTFASVETTYKYLKKPNSLGLLITDEAGQVSPECAAGALFRASKALIVGDPKQIPPVVTETSRIAKLLSGAGREGYSMDESVQSVADNCNPYGTMIDGQWVGCPLVIHSRCISPMFDICNKLSYEGIMINTAKLPENRHFILPNSCWVQVRGREGGGDKNYFVKRQAEVALKMILEACVEAARDHKESDHKMLSEKLSLLVITPFVSVADGMKNYISYFLRRRKDTFIQSGKNNGMEREYIRACDILKEWKNKGGIGTVHTFQGKEADQVILLLGCSNTVDSRFAAKWISKNIVNVSASRAKYRFYIVGDMDIWRKHQGELSESPVNMARRTINHYICGVNDEIREGKQTVIKEKYGAADLNKILFYTKVIKLPTGKEKDELVCPNCQGAVTLGKKNGWFCHRDCGMQFKVVTNEFGGESVFNINGVSIKKLLSMMDSSKKELSGSKDYVEFSTFSHKTGYVVFGIYPELIITEGEEKDDIYFRSVLIPGEDGEKRSKKNIRLKPKYEEEKEFSDRSGVPSRLLCNCSLLIQNIRSNKGISEDISDRSNLNIDYFDIMLIDAVYTLERQGRKGFGSIDILRLISGREKPDYKAPIRKSIESRMEKLMKVGLYSSRTYRGKGISLENDDNDKKEVMLPNVQGVGSRYRFIKGADRSFLMRFIDERERVQDKALLSIPVMYLNGVDESGRSIFPMTEKWLQIVYYIMYRLAYMYKTNEKAHFGSVSPTSKRISFSTMEKSLELMKEDKKESNLDYTREEKRRFYARVEKYLKYLEDKKYIAEYTIGKSRGTEGYCGIAYIEV